MAKKGKKKKGMFGVGDDIFQLGTGIIGAAIVTTVVNRMSGGHHGGPGTGPDGGDPDGGGPEGSAGPLGPVSDYIGEISGRMGMPKPAIVKGIVGVGFVFAADKMPQYRTSFLFIAGILLWDAITSHPRVCEAMGIHGTTLAGTDELNKIEADLRSEIEATKEAMQGVLAGYPGSPSVDGVVLAGGYPGSPEVSGNMFGHEQGSNNYNSLGL